MVPFTVKVSAPLPAITVSGERPEIVGCGLGPALLTARFNAAEVPPPGAGFATAIDTLPGEAMSAGGIAAVICKPLTKVVARAAPLASTIEPFMKPEPFTVKVNPALPAVTLLGEMLDSDGVGLALVTVRFSVPDVPPPGAGFATETDRVPAEAVSPAGIAAVSCVLLMKVVV